MAVIQFNKFESLTWSFFLNTELGKKITIQILEKEWPLKEMAIARALARETEKILTHRMSDSPDMRNAYIIALAYAAANKVNWNKIAKKLIQQIGRG